MFICTAFTLLTCRLMSCTANIMVRYLGEVGKDTPIVAAVSMCNPFDLVSCRPFTIRLMALATKRHLFYTLCPALCWV